MSRRRGHTALMQPLVPQAVPHTPKLLREWLLPVLTTKNEMVIMRRDGGVS